jgi:gamma-glutamyltranspeptidase/glutathione hydrolase
MDYRCEHWQISKPAKVSEAGMVAAQNAEAAAVGAEVLSAGGNAVDAAVATAFALGTTEPWMSGIGGGGYMLVYIAAEQRTYAIDYAMVAPAGIDVGRYALTGEAGPEDGLFVWPRVVEDRNLQGAESICVPGATDGLGLVLERFGTITWRDALAPAIALAEKGLAADWWNTLQIAYGAADLMRFESSRDIYLPGGVPPTSSTPSNPTRIKLGNLATTLKQLPCHRCRPADGRLSRRHGQSGTGPERQPDLRARHAHPDRYSPSRRPARTGCLSRLCRGAARSLWLSLCPSGA